VRAGFSPPRFGEGPGERLTRHKWDPKRWQAQSPRGWANGKPTILGRTQSKLKFAQFHLWC